MTTAQQVKEVDEGYQRGLKNRQIGMMAISGAIGTGLFYGSGTAIHNTGPGLILCYVLAGAMVFLIMRALGELLLYRTVSGSFAEYAEEFLGPLPGFITGWIYWAMWVTTCMAEVTVAGKYVQFWINIPQWVTAAVVLVLLFGANLISVKVFGEFEFWFSMIKVVTIVLAIVIGLTVIIFGLGPIGQNATFANLIPEGGMFPNGFGAGLLALQGVTFAYLGVELVGLTAGEAKDPEKVLPKAINSLMLRIGIFYVGALSVLLALLPWTSFPADNSPFVIAFSKLGIPAIAGIINFVLLTAALSSCNSGIYSTGRMLRTLAVRGSAPAQMKKLSTRKVPAVGITASAGVMAVGILINAVAPDEAFLYITSVATVGVLWTWAVILLSHWHYRNAVAAGRLPASSFRMPGAPVTTVLGLLFIAAVTVLLAFTEDTRPALYIAVPAGIVLVGAYFVQKAQRPA